MSVESRARFSLDKVLERKTAADWERSTYISLKNRYVFLRVGKAASSTVTQHLERVESEGSPFTVGNPNRRDTSPHLLPFQLPADQVADIMESPDWKRVTFVRNPFTRTLSCYLHRVVATPRSPTARAFRRVSGDKGTPTFARFVEVICQQPSVEMERHWRCQADEVLDGLIELDFVGRQEHLDRDVPELSNVLFGRQVFEDSVDVDKSPKPTGASTKLGEHYTDKLAAMLVERYERDFELFGYSTDLSQAT
ncbi:sulfotransferase family protein [Haloactinopolyspora alba]|uniref:Sulfotransferase family protein n=1 Tax=Haloactinopolyspora alba TaxID=648780 RepID=A0A2P8DT55_9ACTN|nr:sulfotransferase family protein [Haloactinopolyspora alba]PSL00397.1 sulfotransferase family protein [Haloactinopolyspora alba]